MLCPAERLVPTVTRLDVARRAVHDLQGRLVAGLVVVAPRAHAVVAQQHSSRFRLLRDEPLDDEADVEPRPLPRHVDHLLAVDLAGELLLVRGSGHRDHRVGVQVVHVTERHEGVERRVDRAGARVQVEDAVRVHRVHRVFDLGLGSPPRMAQVHRLHGPDLLEIQRSEPVALGRPEVAPRTLHPEDLHVRAREGVLLDELRRRVPAARVGQGEVLAELVRAIDEPVQASEGRRLLLPPPALHLARRAGPLPHSAYLSATIRGTESIPDGRGRSPSRS